MQGLCNSSYSYKTNYKVYINMHVALYYRFYGNNSIKIPVDVLKLASDMNLDFKNKQEIGSSLCYFLSDCTNS